MVTLFFSYSHKDEALRNEIETHLSLLKRQGVISSWHDRRITAGSDIHDSISEEIESAQIILLLVSAYFLDSDYCFEKELRRALEKHKEGTAVVIPVILHPCDWQSGPFGHLRATPTDSKAISMFANPHEAFAIVARDIREAATRLASLTPPSPTVSADLTQSEIGTAPRQHIRSSNLRVKKTFDDQERDAFLEDSFEYIARFFAGSLEELEKRYSNLKTRFKRLDATSFSASIYDAGKRVGECSVWYGRNSFRSREISYSHSSSAPRNSWNESLSVVDDGYTIQLQTLGMQMTGQRSDDTLSQEGAAEYFWSLPIHPLQE